MNPTVFALVFALMAGLGFLWSLSSRPSLTARIDPEIVFRPNEPRRDLASFGSLQLHKRMGAPASARHSLQVSDFGSVLGLVLSNGETVIGAIEWVSKRMTSSFGRELRKCVFALHAGSSLNTELAKLSTQRRFASYAETLERLARAAELGTDVTDQVQVLADASLSAHRVDLLARQSKIELRMLLPLVFLILPTTILFAVYPSLLMLQLIEI